MSAAVPWGGGQYVLTVSALPPIETTADDMPVPISGELSETRVALNPFVHSAQKAWAWMAQIPPHQLHRMVPRLTNIAWTFALIMPVLVAGGQLVQLRFTGRTWPRQWLGIQVISTVGGQLSLLQVVTRETVRWGLPVAVVGGGTMVTGISLGVWTPVAVSFFALVESATMLTSARRAWHDRIAKTQVTIIPAGYLPISGESLRYSLPMSSAPMSEEISSIQLYGETANDDDDWWLTEAEGNLTSLVLPPRSLQNGGSLTLSPLANRSSNTNRSLWLVTSGLVLACLVGFGMGRVFQPRAAAQSENDAFLQTAQALMAKTQAGGDYRAAILMLAQVDDPRMADYLADLLSQSSQPEMLATIQQALVSQGLDSLPSLLTLSRVLENDLQQSLDGDTRHMRLEQRHVVQGAIAKILTTHSNGLAGINLDRVNLGRHHDADRSFRLIQPGLLAAGTSWQGANLSQANLAGASFFDVGADGKPDSYDDIISDLSGVTLVAASLEDANLQGIQLSHANLRRADLRDANLTYGNLARTQLTNARLVHVNAPQSQWQGSNLVGADLTQAIFEQADLSRARLNRIEAAHSRWTKATLPQTEWVGANLIGADFSHANLTAADFQDAQLDGVDFTQADLRQVNLRDADLRQATLTGSTLTDADLAGAIFDDGMGVTGSFITPNAQLNAVNHLQGVNFSRVRNLDGRQLNYICAQGGIHPACQQVLDAE
ncbi:pentapeptide repeat-containing protein [Leptolyngbya sp. Heron Island J]|uniref:pentapeptide repeat-containing protein n=1 Tax=Leptolyngbya sp. Heron Island J TaxID=1385935 RepID=UPI001F381FCE|nr:pentapeptide repeat-containing protein [Leptolyngbya sp. Heron Island J]